MSLNLKFLRGRGRGTVSEVFCLFVVSKVVSLSFCTQCIGTETLGKRICELGLIIGIIIGRWLLPRGEITRDQLSALLLGYVGTAADILELFEVFDDSRMNGQWSISLAVLGVYSWSLLQFCLVTTATTGKEQIKIASNKVRFMLLSLFS